MKNIIPNSSANWVTNNNYINWNKNSNQRKSKSLNGLHCKEVF